MPQHQATNHEDSFLNLSLPERITFLDICAGTNDRLEFWRQKARERRTSEDTIQASFAVDIDPKSAGVIKADVLNFLSSLRRESVLEVNGDFALINDNKSRHDSDSTLLGLIAIFAAVKRALATDGIFRFTAFLSTDQEVREAAQRNEMKIRPTHFGYAGFLGGRNKRFPVDGLPPVEQATPRLKALCEEVKNREETDPLAGMFVEHIGTTGYLRDNPVRYKITRRRGF